MLSKKAERSIAASSLAAMAGALPAQSLPMLDGESATPAHLSTTYAFECATSGKASSYHLVLSRDRAGPVLIKELVGQGKPISAKETAKIQLALVRFSYIDNVTPRCVIGGGATLLFGGGVRPGHVMDGSRSAVRASVSPSGIVTVHP